MRATLAVKQFNLTEGMRFLVNGGLGWVLERPRGRLRGQREGTKADPVRANGKNGAYPCEESTTGTTWECYRAAAFRVSSQPCGPATRHATALSVLQQQLSLRCDQVHSVSIQLFRKDRLKSVF